MPLRKTKKSTKKADRKAYRFLALPDDAQKEMFSRTFGCVRYLYNRMLDDRSKTYRYFKESLFLTPAWYKQLSCCRWRVKWIRLPLPMYR